MGINTTQRDGGRLTSNRGVWSPISVHLSTFEVKNMKILAIITMAVAVTVSYGLLFYAYNRIYPYFDKWKRWK